VESFARLTKGFKSISSGFCASRVADDRELVSVGSFVSFLDLLNRDFHFEDFSERSGGESVRVPLLDDKLWLVKVTVLPNCSIDVVLENCSPTSSAEKGCSPVMGLGVLGGGVSLMLRLPGGGTFSK
jgi:hypothetical protein